MVYKHVVVYCFIHFLLITTESLHLLRMSETGFPGTYSTTTETNVVTNIRFDPSYVRTVPGMLKIAVMVCLIGLFQVPILSQLFFTI